MNYCEKIHYTILNTEPAEFAVMVDDPSVLWGLRTGFELCLPTAAERSFADGGT